MRAAIAVLLLLLASSAAHAEQRIALIITNQAYKQSGAALTNTHRDGDLVKVALEKVGFKVWLVRDTASEGAMLVAIGDHVGRLVQAGPDAVGFLYYSGHGAADRPDGANYLIPTDAPITHLAQLPLMAVRLDRITATLASAARMSFVVFDACRNVALQRDAKDYGFKGLAPIREQRGLLVAYATEPGSVAIDQSVYARALADEIVKPGLEAGQVFRAVTRRVWEATERKQSPEYLDKRFFDFHFAARTPSTQSEAPVERPPSSGVSPLPAVALPHELGSARPIEEALVIAGSIDGSLFRVGALGSIAVAQSKVGRTKEATATLDQALQIARMNSEADDRARDLTSVAEAQTKIGMIQEAHTTLTEAVKVANLISTKHSNYSRDSRLGSIASAQANARNITEALKLLQSIKDQNTRDQVLSTVVSVQAQAGNFREALELARSIKDAQKGYTELRSASVPSLTDDSHRCANQSMFGDESERLLRPERC